MTRFRVTAAAILSAAALLAAATAAGPLARSAGAERSELSASDLAFIGGVIELVEHNYVHSVGASELTKDALKGMLARLDPHSDYMDEEEFKQSQGSITGRFGGLGMEISQQAGLPKVISPIDGTPAARAGLQPGDLILSIDRQSTHGMDLTKVVTLLRGDPGTSVTLNISRGETPPFDVTLKREIIHVQSVKSRLQPNDIGYVRITEFAGDTGKQFRSTIDDLQHRASGGRLKGLVLDLRNDPGGLLTAAVEVAGNLLDGGGVVSIRGRRPGDEQAYTAPAKGDMLPGTPVVVLVNGASASASEIVAGALQDRHRATVMGTQSFGKGSVQSIIPLKGHGALRLTTALYYTPSGRSIQDEGIAPDIVVEAPKDVQIAGGVLLRESELHGAITNPGSLGPKTHASAGKRTDDQKDARSAPIKTELIGTPQDGQLKAALADIQKRLGATNQPG